MDYEHRIVAYIDILGFADLVKQTVNPNNPKVAKEKLKTLYEVVEYVNDFIRLSRDEIGFEGNTMATMFSDAIVISVDKANSHGILSIFATLKKLQIHLIRDKILLRGGIVHGRLIHKSDILIGPALIDAYKLESSAAMYPRIVIDSKVTSLYSRTDGRTNGKLRIRHYDYHKTFQRDFDNTYFIDYFSDIEPYLQDVTIEEYMSLLNEIIVEGKKRPEAGIRMKYSWMKSRYSQSEYHPLFPKP